MSLIRNDNIGKKLELASIEGKMKENQIRWLGHVTKMIKCAS